MTMETILQSSNFPKGMRVLVVDDDSTCLSITEKMLQYCRYEVTSCNQATIALEFLRERKGEFDLVITDVQMPDMGGFELLEHIKLEMDVPVMMMSASWEAENVMEGLDHGACFYFTKPITIKQVTNVWQHVYTKRACEIKEIEQVGNDQLTTCNTRGLENTESETSVNERNCKKSKLNDDDEKEDNEDPSSTKKSRIIWTPKLHRHFLSAIHQIGFDKCVPKKILEVMNVPELTRENVASHLQKYRLYLRRIQNESRYQARNPEPWKSIFATFPPEFKQDVHQRSFSTTLGQPNRMAIQPRQAGNFSNCNTPTKFPTTNLMHFFNQEPQRNNSGVTLRYGQSFYSKQGNFQQVRPRISSQSSPPPTQRYNGNPGFQMAHHQEHLGSSSHGYIPQTRPALFGSGQLGNNFNLPSGHAQNDRLGQLGSFNNFTAHPLVNYANNYGGSQMTSSGVSFGLPQTRSTGEPMNNINTGYNISNEISHGTTAHETEHGPFLGTNQFSRGSIPFSFPQTRSNGGPMSNFNTGYNMLNEVSDGKTSHETEGMIFPVSELSPFPNTSQFPMGSIPFGLPQSRSNNELMNIFNTGSNLSNEKTAHEREGMILPVPELSPFPSTNQFQMGFIPFGLPQTRSNGGPTNNINTGYNLLNEISHGETAHETEGTILPASKLNPLPSTNQFLRGSNDEIDPENELVPGYYSKKEDNPLLDVMKSSGFQNNEPLSEFFSDANLIDLVFNQPQEGHGSVEP